VCARCQQGSLDRTYTVASGVRPTGEAAPVRMNCSRRSHMWSWVSALSVAIAYNNAQHGGVVDLDARYCPCLRLRFSRRRRRHGSRGGSGRRGGGSRESSSRCGCRRLRRRDARERCPPRGSSRARAGSRAAKEGKRAKARRRGIRARRAEDRLPGLVLVLVLVGGHIRRARRQCRPLGRDANTERLGRCLLFCC
jgi:hypothetical protein